MLPAWVSHQNPRISWGLLQYSRSHPTYRLTRILALLIMVKFQNQ